MNQKFALLVLAMMVWLGIPGLHLRVAANSETPPLAESAPQDESVTDPDSVPASETLRDAVLLRAIGQLREAVEATGRDDIEKISTRLMQIEQTLEQQRDREFAAMQKANRSVLVAITALVTLGLIGVTLMGIFMFKTVNRIAETATLHAPRSWPVGGAQMLNAGAGNMTESEPGPDPSSRRLLGLVDQLQKRIEDLERTATPAIAPEERKPGRMPSGNGKSPTEASERRAAERSLEDRVNVLFEKGHAHLNLGQYSDAEACFAQLIAVRPDHAEACLKRGAALEKLERFDEALECFNRAIELDSHLATAYLCKGGVYNRLERFDEALECYEMALRAGREEKV